MYAYYTAHRWITFIMFLHLHVSYPKTFLVLCCTPNVANFTVVIPRQDKKTAAQWASYVVEPLIKSNRPCFPNLFDYKGFKY